MKNRILCLSIFFFSCSLVFGQLGISAAYFKMNAPNWGDYGAEICKDGFFSGVVYWFPEKKYRVDLRLKIFFGHTGQEQFTATAGERAGEIWRANSTFLGIRGNVRFYFFDWEGDCNCPTWSKRGDVFKKGFFVQFGPTAAMLKFEAEIENFGVEEKFSSSETLYGLNIGAGIDLGLSELITLTPYFAAEYLHDVDSNCENCLPAEGSSYLMSAQFGLHLGLRWQK